MATTTDQIKTDYPLPVYNYKVNVYDYELEGVPGLGTITGGPRTINFTEVSGLSIEQEPVTYKHGLSFITGSNIMYGMKQPVNITLKKGIFAGDAFFKDWIGQEWTDLFFGRAKKNLTIDLCDEKGNTIVRWMVFGALPKKLDAPTFDASANEIAIESLELIAHEVKVDYEP